MLQTLKDAQAKVTFFTNAKWLHYMHYVGVTRHAYMRVINTSSGLTNNDIKEDIGRASRTIHNLIGVYPKFIKVHEASIKDLRLLNIVKSMGYGLVGFNLDEYYCKYNTLNKAGHIAEVYNSIFSKQGEAYGRKAHIITGYDVPTMGAAAALSEVINTINAYGYDMEDPTKDNGYVSDAKSFGGQEYKHGQVNINANNYSPSKGAGSYSASKGATDDDRLAPSSATEMNAVASTLLAVPAVPFSLSL